MVTEQHIEDLFEDKARGSGKDAGAYAVAFALLKTAKQQERLANAVRALGNGDASTPMGAIEAFGDLMGKKLDRLIDVLDMRSGE